MARFSRSIPDSVLARGIALVGTQMDALDETTYRSLNGDGGGTWSPTSPINIDGAGMMATGPWIVTGAADVKASEFEFGEGSSADAWRLDAGHPARNVTLYTQFVENFTLVPDDIGYWHAPWMYTGPAAYGITTTIYSTSEGLRFAAPLMVYDGALLTTVAIYMRVTSNHGPPQYLPRMRVVAHDGEGNVIKMRPQSSDTDSDGFINWSPAPATGTSWYSSGNTQTFTYTCTQNNVIDISKYFYYVEIIEEYGTSSYAVGNSGNIWVAASALFSNITYLDNRM